MTDYPARTLPTDLPRSVEEMLLVVAERMRRMNPKTDAEIDEMYEEFGGEDEDGNPINRETEEGTPEERWLHRLTEEGINEQVDATVERRGLQKVG